MTHPEGTPTWNCRRNCGIAVAMTAMTLALIGFALPAQAQTLTVLHNFGGPPPDGANPFSGLTMDAAGNLYGTTGNGGIGNGMVFELQRTKSGFIFRPLYSFEGGNDGAMPSARVTIGPNASLYGTTVKGGGTQFPFGVGTVFNAQPPPSACKAALCSWRETILFPFNQGTGYGSYYSEVTFDSAGNLYGVTNYGGKYNHGEVYQLTPSNGGWSESIIYTFGEHDPSQPVGGVVFDQAGNLYGTTRFGGAGFGYGAVFQLTPSGQGWTENTLYEFQGGADQGNPQTSLIIDSSGNLYGTTPWFLYGNDDGGTVYEISPSGGGWTYTLLYDFPSAYEGAGWVSPVTMDKDGNLYGTTSYEGITGGVCVYGCGTVFKLTPSAGGGWTYTDLYNFTGGADGAIPYSGVVLDSQGNLYGTTSIGGTGKNCNYGDEGCGVVWKLTP